jgi:hypothetical protein
MMKRLLRLLLRCIMLSIVVSAALARLITAQYQLGDTEIIVGIGDKQGTLPAFVAVITGFFPFVMLALVILELMLNGHESVPTQVGLRTDNTYALGRLGGRVAPGACLY